MLLIKFNNNTLELSAQGLNQEDLIVGVFYLKEDSGTIMIYNEDCTAKVLIPMDPSIHIKEAFLDSGLIHIKVCAEVDP